ncbi:MAG: FkbM family methyltransferase [Candidatus Bilamarchaeaceae archaeon]
MSMNLIFKLLKKINPKSTTKFFHKSYAQSGEDMILDTIFGHLSHGYYVDVGAHDPFFQSNTQYFYEKGWTGINIDANEDSIKMLSKIRKRDKNILAFISNEEREFDFYIYEKSPYSSCFYRSDIPSKIKKIKKVKSVRLEKIFEQEKIKNINFLSIDTEGNDFNVLLSFDIKKIRPQIIIVESFCYNIFDDLNTEITKYLRDNDYFYFCKTVTNTFYISKEFAYERFKIQI